MAEQLAPHDIAHLREQAAAREAQAAELARDLQHRPETLPAFEGHIHDAAAAYERAGDPAGAARVRAMGARFDVVRGEGVTVTAIDDPPAAKPRRSR